MDYRSFDCKQRRIKEDAAVRTQMKDAVKDDRQKKICDDKLKLFLEPKAGWRSSPVSDRKALLPLRLRA